MDRIHIYQKSKTIFKLLPKLVFTAINFHIIDLDYLQSKSDELVPSIIDIITSSIDNLPRIYDINKMICSILNLGFNDDRLMDCVIKMI